MFVRVMIVIAAFWLCIPQVLAQEALVVDLAEDHVDITTGFNGATLALFGVKEEDCDVAVVISGPKLDTIVRRKDQMMGAWLNRSSMKFRNVPLFYDYALSNTEDEIAPAEVLKTHEIGLNALRFEPDTSRAEAKTIKSFQEALIRNKQSQGLFPLHPRDIIFLSTDFFRTNLYIPPNVTMGNYTIKTFLIKGGIVKDVKTTSIRVAQVGAGAGIYRFAHTQSFTYGFLCVCFAVFAGWLSNNVRRRD